MASSESLLKLVVATAELMGTELSEDAARIMLQDLGAFPEEWVTESLARCRRECKGRLTVAAIIERLGDGRPGPEEAWSMIPRDEWSTLVWTDEMATAYGVASPLLFEDGPIPARMAFLEKYRELVAAARSKGQPPKWQASLGWDKAGREGPIREAVEMGRLSAKQADLLLPSPEADQAALPKPRRRGVQSGGDAARKAIADMRAKLRHGSAA